MPILPVHFLRNEELPMCPQGKKQGVTMSGGVSHVFDRFCSLGRCNVTTRWGHAHPTWTYWALPFLGRWLRRHLRDETLEGPVPLRVSDIDVDEDLLNIGTWEEGGHKQLAGGPSKRAFNSEKSKSQHYMLYITYVSLYIISHYLL